MSKRFLVTIAYTTFVDAQDELEATDKAFVEFNTVADGDDCHTLLTLTEIPVDQEMLDENDRLGEL